MVRRHHLLLLSAAAAAAGLTLVASEFIPTSYADDYTLEQQHKGNDAIMLSPYLISNSEDDESVIGDVIDVISPIVKDLDWDCEPVDFTKLNKEINAANSLISFAQNSSVINSFRKNFNEMELVVHRTVPMVKKILGVEMLIDTVATSLGISGLQHLTLQPIEATSYNMLRLKASTPEVLTVHNSFSIQYTKKMKNFLGLFPYCPLELSFWKQCPTYTLEVDASFDLKNVELDIVTEVNVYQCDSSAGFWNKWACRFTSAWHFVSSIFKLPTTTYGVDANNPVVQEMFRRVRSIHLHRHDIKFDTANTKVQVKWNKEGGLSKEHVKDAEFQVRERLTHGFFKKQIFKSASKATRDTFNTILSVMEPLCQAQCARRR